jgi:hypothetical protein
MDRIQSVGIQALLLASINQIKSFPAAACSIQAEIINYKSRCTAAANPKQVRGFICPYFWVKMTHSTEGRRYYDQA